MRGADVKGLRVGYIPTWMKESSGDGRRSRGARRRRGSSAWCRPRSRFPIGRTTRCNLILFAEAAAAFEELTLSGQADQLKVQVPDAWPNLFREARFLSAVDFVQADRLRRKVARRDGARDVARWICCSCRRCATRCSSISNFTGHPSLTLRAGFVERVGGAQRLGARSSASAAEVLAAAARAARRDADRPAVR